MCKKIFPHTVGLVDKCYINMLKDKKKIYTVKYLLYYAT